MTEQPQWPEVSEVRASRAAYGKMPEEMQVILRRGLIRMIQLASLKQISETPAEIIQQLETEIPGIQDALIELDRITENILTRDVQ
jgi:hypothetical protein